MNSVKHSKRKAKKSLRRPAVKLTEIGSTVEELSQVSDQGTSVDLKPDLRSMDKKSASPTSLGANEAESSKQPPRQSNVESEDHNGVPVRMSVENLEKLGVVNLLQGDIFTIGKLL